MDQYDETSPRNYALFSLQAFSFGNLIRSLAYERKSVGALYARMYILDSEFRRFRTNKVLKLDFWINKSGKTIIERY
jgi:hypothetical protein